MLPALPPAEAVAAFRNRGKRLEPSFAWQDLWHEDHATAFTVAKSTGFDILKDLHQSLADALANGTLEKDWRRQITPILQAKGWWGRQAMEDPLTGETKMVQLGSARRLHVIFDTNLRTAHAAGRWAQIERSAELAPFLRYSAVLDSRTRPEHREWNGTVLRWDHPWWDTHFPPNGWFCRCTVTQMGESDLARLGLTESDGPPADPAPPRAYINPRTGEVSEVPAGIDPGFAYNPGRTGSPPAPTTPPASPSPSPAPLAAPLAETIPGRAARAAAAKWVDAPPALAAAAGKDATAMLPALEADFATWVERIATGQAHAMGDKRVVGTLSEPVLEHLAAEQIVPESGAITLLDRDLTHFIRRLKKDLGKAPDLADLEGIPSSIANPQVVIWDADQRNLLYVTAAAGDEDRTLKLVVAVNHAIKQRQADGKRAIVQTNAVIHASRMDAQILSQDRRRYILIEGSLE
ncbi:Mu-like prophage FluMu F protein [Paramagnetospirillum magneticum AMB-1]|uniref:Mu-like prophage FluMu F protein n=2 Tax=Paramagnetospirillum magneticum TaxID=84159 RepID=Q2W6F6_PARM1|nr:Mu-like prophage FluMu F protein [Paramagnetospirillum magneticum AMB-1]